MKRIILNFALAFAGVVFAAMDVQPLAPGGNTLMVGPGVVSQIEAVASDATGTLTVKRVIDLATWSTSAATITNGVTNAVVWTSSTVTNEVVSFQDVYLTVTNAVYTNVVKGVTNVVRDIVRRQNGIRPVTNDVVTVTSSWTNTPFAFRTSTVTNDVLSHVYITNTVGTITLSSHTGTLVPTNLHLTAGDVLILDAGTVTGASARLYLKED